MFYTSCLHPPSTMELLPSVMGKALGEVLLEQTYCTLPANLEGAPACPAHAQAPPARTSGSAGKKVLVFSIPQEKQVSPVQPAPQQPVAISTEGKVF